MIKEGTIIEGPFWPGPLEIKKVEELGAYVRIIGATISTGKYFEQVLSRQDLEKIKISELLLDFSVPGDEAFLSIEGERYKLASLFDPLLAMNTSKIDPLPFQIEAVYGYALKLPSIRFLIADDPGAGKTIMGGLILKELKLRGVVKRILLVVPGHLKNQWIREMKEKFQEHFTVIDRGFFNAHYGENPWEKENQVITSIDFAKREEILPAIGSARWDLVLVDEAHKMAAYKYGGQLKKTERYKLGEVLTKNTDHLLFLTATPHRGDPENFRLFLDLLFPGFFATQELIEESLKNKDNPLFIRRMKEDMRDFEGKPIFTNRYPFTVKFRLSEKEKKLYNEVSKYVVSQYNLAFRREAKRNVAFALLILQRRMASSTFALWKSLERRKNKLQELLKEPEMPGQVFTVRFREIEDYEEKERWEQEKKWETLSLAENKDDLEKEIKILQELQGVAKEILEEESEIKLSELKKVMEKLGDEKILIFTEAKDTLIYLVDKIKSWGYSVNFIHGGMRIDDRIEAEKIFRDQTQIMVATEAAGEGINLQFCHLMINYDIPWNPNRLEQRMGRIHRYGQQKDVHVFNLVAEDTREGQVLVRMFDKLEEIRKAVGSDKVFDVIGNIFFEKDLYGLILDAVANTKSMNEILTELEEIRVDENYIKKVKDALLGESLATRHIDYTRIKELTERTKEYRLIPEYVEEFFKKGFQKAGGKIRVRQDGFMAIDSIPYEIRKISKEIDFKNQYSFLLKTYPRITFDKEVAFKNPDVEFVSFGHPLLEALLLWVKRNYFNKLRKGAAFQDPSARFNGSLWFFEEEITDGKGSAAGKKLLTIYDDGKELTEVNPAILWDFIPLKKGERGNFDLNKGAVQEFAISASEKYKEEILEERKRQAGIKEKYGIRSLEYLIGKLDADLIELDERRARGERVEIVIRNKGERKKEYEEALRVLKQQISQEVSLTFSMPRLLTVVLIEPTPSKEREMVSSEDMEKIGMNVAMNYEKEQGRSPEDVSKENLGFDIRSRGKEGVKYIEVKARAKEGNVLLTPNEWFKAKRFKDQYWLYIIANAATEPTLYLINDPVNNLQIQEKIEVVRFLVSLKEWKAKGEKIL